MRYVFMVSCQWSYSSLLCIMVTVLVLPNGMKSLLLVLVHAALKKQSNQIRRKELLSVHCNGFAAFERYIDF